MNRSINIVEESPGAEAGDISTAAGEASAADMLRRWVQRGPLRPGQRLPSERDLSDRLKVDRAVIRRTLTQLTEEGLVRRTSPRIRVVAPAPERRSWLTANAVAMLSAPPDHRLAGHVHPGWLEYIGQAAFAAARERGWHVVAVHPDGLDERMVEDLLAERPRGLIVPELCPGSGLAEQLLRMAQGQELPMAVYGETEDLGACDHVVSDHRAGASQLTDWLVARGCRRILPVFERNARAPAWVAQRLEGYREAIAKSGLQPLDAVFVPPVSETHGRQQAFDDAVRQMAGHLVPWLTGATPVDALMVVSDRPAYIAAGACRLFGREPHKDITIVGYDNYWEDCANERMFEPCGPQATVDKQNEQIGRALVDLLDERMNSPLPNPPRHRVVAPRLVECVYNQSPS